MLKRLFATVAVLTAAIAAGVALAALPLAEAAPSPQAVEAVPRTAEPGRPEGPGEESPASAPQETGYLLGEYNGRVSVLSPATREPEMIFDIFVRTLPDPDQELLRQGIRVATYEELTRLIEDYIS